MMKFEAIVVLPSAFSHQSSASFAPFILAFPALMFVQN